MYVLDREWEDRYQDYALLPGTSRVRVGKWVNLERIDDAFVQRDRSWRLVWNYLGEIGPRSVWRKIRSRSAERLRNTKYLSCGVGTILESRAPDLEVGQAVVFLAPFHPRCVDVVVLHDAFLAPSRGMHGVQPGAVAYGAVDRVPASLEAARAWAGWSEHAGREADRGEIQPLLGAVDSWLQDPPATLQTLPVRTRDISDRLTGRSVPAEPSQLRGVLFGLGNYAKTTILPNLDDRIAIQRIHEIDPTQLGPIDGLACDADTSPELRDGDEAEVVFIAGFHHTHTDLAIDALERGAYAVIEKPVSTQHQQLDRLVDALERTPGKAFACFHKRYHRFNTWVRQDLQVEPATPVHGNCIVFEIPLPERHWYNWPNSGSRLISNGCHWIDHFLLFNDYAEPVDGSVWTASDGTIAATLELTNGASFTMTLTDHGSSRLGVQDHVEFRTNGATATITNGARYVAESTDRVLRRGTVNRLAVYGEMYREISRRIAAGEPGDSARSLVVTTRTMLMLEDLLQARSGSKSDAVGISSCSNHPEAT